MKLLNIPDVAKRLAISARTLYQWHWLGKNFPFVKVGRTLRVDESDLDQFIIEGKMRATSDKRPSSTKSPSEQELAMERRCK